MTAERRIACVCLVAAAALGSLSACASSPRQTTVVQVEKAASEGLTPLQRGKVRREALAAAKTAVAVWLERDFEAMKPLFSEAQITYYRAEAARLAGEGLTRMRVHKDVALDVVEMDDAGTQVVIRYGFVNGSYTTGRSGTVVSPATDKKSELEITMQKLDGAWVVQKMFAGKESLE